MSMGSPLSPICCNIFTEWLNKIWKSSLCRNIKVRLFNETVESVLLYGAETWTITNKIQKSLDGCYSRMLRAALNVSWKDKITNHELYGELPLLSQKLKEQRLRFAGHCHRSQGEIGSTLVLWPPRHGHKKHGRPPTTYVDVLGKDTGPTTEELETTMRDRSAWRAIIGVRPRSTFVTYVA